VAAAIESQAPTEAVAMQLSAPNQEEQHHYGPFVGLVVAMPARRNSWATLLSSLADDTIPS